MAENLSQLINSSSSYCLNENPTRPYQNLFSTDSSQALESLADEQLLLHLSFSQASRLQKITLGLPLDNRCPRVIKIFVNPDPSISFDDAGSKPPIQTIEVPFPETCDATPGQSLFTIKLAPLKWKNTQSLAIFVEDNHGADLSALTFFGVHGSTLEGADLSKGMPSG